MMSNFSKIILGTAQLGLNYGINNKQGKPSLEQAFDILKSAKHRNIEYLDTAAAYGDSESIIGNFHMRFNTSFKVITKFHTEKDKSIQQLLEESASRMAKSQLEVVLFHSYSDFINQPEVFSELIEAKKNGLVSHIGVSIYTNKELESLLNTAEIDIIQLPFNILDNEAQKGDLLRKAKDHGKTIHTRSVFLQGLFFMAPDRLPKNLSPLQSALTVLNELSKDSGFSMNHLALSYVLQKNYIDGVLIGVEHAEQLKQNIKAVDQPIGKGLVQRIDALLVENTALLNPVNWNT